MLFFLGGGFYPVYMMSISIRGFNPAWASHLLAEWVYAEGPAEDFALIQYMIPAVVCALLTIRLWRRNLR
jgi:hypothetical protein